MSKTIKIAPDVNEVSVVGNEIRTDFAGGSHHSRGQGVLFVC